MERTVCELFAGVGGFRLGLEAAGDWKTTWFSQWEPGRSKQWAHDCYTSHFGDVDEFTGIDIAEVDKSVIPDHNLLVGGFPCQDYSVARPLPGSTGIEGKKGVLWWQIVDTLRTKQAPFALFENVDRLLRSPSSQRGRDFGIMLACLDDLGYYAQWRVVNAADYGAGQRRRRIFIFASRKDTTYSRNLAYSPEEVITQTGFFGRAFPAELAGAIREGTWGKNTISQVSDEFKFDFPNSGFMREGKIYCAPTTSVSIPARTLGELLEKDVEERYFLGDSLESWRYLKGAKRVERTSKTGHKYTFSEGAISFPDPLDRPARTLLTSESSVNRSSHVVKDPQTGRLRLITPVEAERIQGFPDNWTNTGMPHKFRYFCMGNALVVPMVTRMGQVLNDIFAAE
ncbi:DNA (cytosine-5-)-methyltransferase [Actinomycetaceae bacterium TAE3-ERU4]|nr:DNA (cytosine-5-)-methyltransferase [Actinomycetaceae bacterium TAE3-ERU4]